MITLTTAGLGDYVPTTDANKIICSIFIYFGVACIGLLLGSYIANMLDDKAYRDAKRKQIDSCPNCARLMSATNALENHPSPGKKSSSTISTGPRQPMIKSPIHLSMRDIGQKEPQNTVYVPRHHQQRSETSPLLKYISPKTPRSNENLNTSSEMPTISESARMDAAAVAADGVSPSIPPPPTPVSAYGSNASSASNPNVLGSPVTRRILGRQKHTRHQSFDVSSASWNPNLRKFSAELPAALTPPTISENVPLSAPNSAPNAAPPVPFHSHSQGPSSLKGAAFIPDDTYDSEDDSSFDSSDESTATIDDIVDEKASKIKAAKYVFLTLKQALVNSMVIIAVGCCGFVLCEEFNIVDSWYFVSHVTRMVILFRYLRSLM